MIRVSLHGVGALALASSILAFQMETSAVASRGVVQPAGADAGGLAALAASPSATDIHIVPDTIDATCSVGVGQELNDWIASIPDGSTLVFPAESCYLLAGDQGLIIDHHQDLTLDGTGSTLLLRTSGTGNQSSAFFIEASRNITIRGFMVDGGNEATGTFEAVAVVDEFKNGASVRAGSYDIEFDRVSWDRLFGFGIIMNTAASHSTSEGWPEDIYIHDCTIRGALSAVAIVAARRVRVVGNHFVDSVGVAFDLEPDSHSEEGGGFVDVLVEDNDFTTYGLAHESSSWFLASNPDDAVIDQAIMDGLTVRGNRVLAGAAFPDNGNYDGLGGLGIRANKVNPKTRFSIIDNWTSHPDTQVDEGSAVMHFSHVEDLVVTGNRQPISNGAVLVSDHDTTGVRIVADNDTAPMP